MPFVALPSFGKLFRIDPSIDVTSTKDILRKITLKQIMKLCAIIKVYIVENVDRHELDAE